MHGMQAWVALPQKDEETDPAFAHHAADALPELSDRGIWARLIAGSAYGLTSGVRTLFPLFYLHAELAAVPASRCRPITPSAQRMSCRAQALLCTRACDTSPGGCWSLPMARTGNLRRGRAGARHAARGASVGPRFIWWNLVSSRRERIEQAKADWKAGGWRCA